MIIMRGEAFDFIELTLTAFVSKSDPPLAYLIEGKHHPRQQIDCVADERQVASEGIPGCIVKLSGVRWFEDERVWGEGLTPEHGTIIGDWRFKAFGVDTSIGKLALRLAVFRATDTCNVAQYIAEPAPEDVAFVLWHLQRFLDGIGESVACESEVLEHEQLDLYKTINSCLR